MPQPTPELPPALEIRDLRKRFSEGGAHRELLAGIDLELAAGERLALVGESGCGKSTLLNLIAGLEPADGGEIRLAGQLLGDLDEAARTRLRRRRIGFVYQGFNLLATLSTIENVMLPLDLDGVPAAESRARAAALLEEVGLAARADDPPDRLSGGEQQRIALARALVHRPGLLLADEPTGNLDAASGRRVLALLTQLQRQRGAALLLVTHSAAVAASADRIVALRDGRLLPLASSSAGADGAVAW